MPCAQCGTAGYVALCVATGTDLCQRCYEGQPTAQERPSPMVAKVRQRRLKREALVVMADKVWSRLEHHGPVYLVGMRRLAARCPRCADTLSVQFIPGTPPRLRVDCHGGCEQLAVCQELLG